MRAEAGAAIGAGRYRLERLRGRGGMASVWRAHDTRLERPVAIKLIAEALASEADFRRRFEREARAAAALSHPHVVKLFDHGLEDDRPYLVMEWIEGPSLAEVARAGDVGSLDVERIAWELLDAVSHIHAAGILHRDIKPANLLLAPDGGIRVTDFGVARLDETTAITRAGMVVGTERYLAPEVARGAPATPASDLFACGAVVAEIGGERLGGTLAALVERLRAPDPAGRPQSADEALAALRGEEAGRRPDPPVTATAVWRAGTGSPSAAPDSAGRGGESRSEAGRGPAASTASRSDAAPTAPGVEPPTGPTAVLADGQRSPARRVVAERVSRLREISPLTVTAAALAVVALAVGVGLALDGDEPPAPPAPAPEAAPLDIQIERLTQLVREIGRDER